MRTVTLHEARKVASGVVLGQAAVTGVAALLCWRLVGLSAALSLVMGGAIGTLASAVMAALAFRGNPAINPLGATGAFFLAELLKLVVTIALFVVALTQTRALPAALLAGYGVTFLVPWLALAASLARPGSGNGPANALDVHAAQRP